MRWGSIFCCAVLAGLLLPVFVSAEEQEEAKFTLNGYFQAQYGLFTNNQYHNQSDPQGFPIDHGDRAGSPSILRNTLLLESDYKPLPEVRLHAVFRGVRSGSLKEDRYAQDPDLIADTKYNEDPAVKKAKIAYVHDHYYTENDLREIYVDFDAAKRINFRIGKQQVSWGDMGNLRMLDVINPVNSTWHLSVFESFEDQRNPLYIAKMLIDVPELKGSLETVFVPLIDKPEDTVNVPLTFVGAWGLPLAPKNEYVSDIRINKKIVMYPANDFSQSRVGARWKGVLGDLTYTLAAFHGHQSSPPIPDHVVKSAQPDAEGFHTGTVYLDVPRLNVYGFSLDYSLESPISTVIKFEGTIETNRHYPVNSPLSAGISPDDRVTTSWEPVNRHAMPGDSDQIAYLHHEERHTLNYALEIFRSNQIRFLNPTGSITTLFRILQNFYFNPEDVNISKFRLGNPYVMETRPDGTQIRNENWRMVDVPGYDTTTPSPMATTLVFAAFTSYFHGTLTPMFVGAFLPRYEIAVKDAGDLFTKKSFDRGSGFAAASLKFSFGDHWRIETGYNYIHGDDPYFDLGFFRDRDEAYTKIKYQF